MCPSHRLVVEISTRTVLFHLHIIPLRSRDNVRRFKKQKTSKLLKFKGFTGDPTGNRTRVTAVKGRCLRPLDHGAILDYGLNHSGRNLFSIKPAMSYFPRQSPAKYLRRWRA